MVLNQPGSSAMKDSTPPLVHSQRQITIPSPDIVTYAFAAYGKYDLDKPIYVDGKDGSNFVSARMARATVRQLIRGLKTQGLEAGDCVCLHAYNNISYPLLWLAVIGAGGRVSGSNPAYSVVPELVHHLQTTNTKFIIAQVECLPTIAQAARKCGISDSRVFVLPSPSQQVPDNYLSWEILLQSGESDWDTFGQDETKASKTIAVLSATSGTTGLPKSAALSHQYVVGQCEMILEHNGGRQRQVSQIICLPIFHAFAAQLALVMPLRIGVTTYFVKKFELQTFAETIYRYSITDTAVVPPIIAMLLKLPPEDEYLLRSLRYIVCAGAPMNADVQTKLYDMLASEAVIAQCWGTTETGWITLFNPHEKDTSGSVGRLLPNTMIKIVDEEGHLVAQDGVHGEAFVQSPTIYKGYLLKPGADATGLDSEGFFRTGDRVFHKDGKLFIDGRIKDIIKVKGWQVSPAELESVLLQHPQVIDVAVIGVNRQNKDDIEETLPRAFVVRKEYQTNGGDLCDYISPPQTPDLPSTQVTEAELQAFVASRVTSYKKLTGGVEFVNKIPRSNTGKILRRLLGGTSIVEALDDLPETLSPLQARTSHATSVASNVEILPKLAVFINDEMNTALVSGDQGLKEEGETLC